MTVSITGNATHAVLHAQALPIVAAAVAIVPPLALLAAVHAVTILLRAHARAKLIHALATLMTVLIAAAAFRLLFTALRDLAVLAGVPDTDAWLWPLIIEGSMAQATVAILALAHSPRAPIQGVFVGDAASTAGAVPITRLDTGAHAEVGRAHGNPNPAIIAPARACDHLGRSPAEGWSQVAARYAGAIGPTVVTPPKSPSSCRSTSTRAAHQPRYRGRSDAADPPSAGLSVTPASSSSPDRRAHRATETEFMG